MWCCAVNAVIVVRCCECCGFLRIDVSAAVLGMSWLRFCDFQCIDVNAVVAVRCCECYDFHGISVNTVQCCECCGCSSVPLML